MAFFTKKKLGLWLSPLIMLTVTGTAIADMDFCFIPYAGVDLQMRHMGFYRDFGGNALKKDYPQSNFFAGFKFNQCLGFEFGYTISEKKSRRVSHENSDIVFGLPLEQADPPEIISIEHLGRSTSRVKGWNANLVSFFPVFCDDNSIQLIGAIGVAQLKVKTKNSLVSTLHQFDATQDSVIVNTQFINDAPNRKFHKKYKSVLRLSGGIQSMITECIGVRALMTWENTAKLKIQGRNTETSAILSTIVIKPKNSFNYGLGMFASF